MHDEPPFDNLSIVVVLVMVTVVLLFGLILILSW